MFYCEECQKRKKWPWTLFRSYGPCEVCKKTAECFECPSALLPRKEER